MIKSLSLNQTPQDVCNTLGWASGTVVTVQNKSPSILRVTQSETEPSAMTEDCIYLMPFQSLTTESGDPKLWIWAFSEAKAALIKRN